MLEGLFRMHDHKQTQEAPVYSAGEFTHSDSAESLSHSQNHSLFRKNTETGLANTCSHPERVLASYSQDLSDLAKDHLIHTPARVSNLTQVWLQPSQIGTL